MAISIDRMKQGILIYGNEEFVNKTPGLSKWLVAMSLPAIAQYVANFMEHNHNMLVSAGYMTEDGMIDCDELYKVAYHAAEDTGDVVQNIPLIGDVKFTKDDVRRMYQCMTS